VATLTARAFDFDVGPGQVLRRFTRSEAAVLAVQWIDVFCANKQVPNLKAYMWHTFSAGIYPNVAGADARTKYVQQAAAEYAVLSNDRDAALLTDALPEACSLLDYYVFPGNMAWTMAFTHEEGWLGPYFAVHPNYSALNAQNLDRIRKFREIGNAKLRGWA
jgi:hypothetical protein